MGKTKENCETQKIEKSNLKSRENRKLKFKKVVRDDCLRKSFKPKKA